VAASHPTARPVIVGHRGASALAPDNTPSGIDAAIRAGADAVELDVRRARSGRLVLAHDRRHARRGRATPLEEALSFLVHPKRAGTGLLVDVKEEDTVPGLVAALEAAGLTQRSIACAREVAILGGLRAAHPFLRRASSLKRARQSAAAHLVPVRGEVAGAADAVVRHGLAELLSVHRSLVTARLVSTVHAAGGEVYVWDVNRADQAVTLTSLGVDGLIGDEPRLLRAASSPQ
jgi:glycerophosphoryl diester phosphodiesterase